jgi:hypothetical protein
MRVPRRPLAVAVVAAGVLPWLVTVATATAPAHRTVRISQYAYYWREQQSNIAGSGVAPPTGPLPDKTVPTGDVAVAGPQAASTPAESGGAEKETYLGYDIASIPVGSRILSFVVSLPVDPAGNSTFPASGAPPIVACLPEGAWSAQPGPQPFSGKPADSCGAKPVAVVSRNHDKTFTANIAQIAQSWLTTGLNTGVAVTDDPHNQSTTYQVVFGPPKALAQLSAQVSYLPPASPGGFVHHAVVPAAAHPPTGTSAGTPTAGGPAAAATGGSVTLPAATLGTPPSSAPAAQPDVAGAPAATAGHTRLLAAGTGTGSSMPGTGFWLAAALLAGLLAICSLALGADGVQPVGPGRGVARRLSRPTGGEPVRL